MRNVSDFLADQLEQSGYIPKEQKQAYAYCYQYIIENIKYDVIILGLSLLMHRAIATILFLIFFNFFRNISGGYHAETRVRCNVISYGIFVGFILGSCFLHKEWIGWTFFIFTLMLVSLSPVENEKKQFNKEQKRKNKKKICILVCIQIVLFFIFFFHEQIFYSYSLAYCNIIIGFSLAIQKYKNMRK